MDVWLFYYLFAYNPLTQNSFIYQKIPSEILHKTWIVPVLNIQKQLNVDHFTEGYQCH